MKLSGEVRDSGAEVTSGDLPAVVCDPDRLIQLFESLLGNAIRQAGTSPRIHVSARLQDGRGWIFAVADNGPGVEAEDLERIFRPFERLSRSHQGAGLELAICQAIVSGHGGRIWAESAAAGTTFYFTLGAP